MRFFFLFISLVCAYSHTRHQCTASPLTHLCAFDVNSMEIARDPFQILLASREYLSPSENMCDSIDDHVHWIPHLKRTSAAVLFLRAIFFTRAALNMQTSQGEKKMFYSSRSFLILNMHAFFMFRPKLQKKINHFRYFNTRNRCCHWRLFVSIVYFYYWKIIEWQRSFLSSSLMLLLLLLEFLVSSSMRTHSFNEHWKYNINSLKFVASSTACLMFIRVCRCHFELFLHVYARQSIRNDWTWKM